MAKINLLPWREELRKKNQKDFLNKLVLSSLLGLVIVGLVHTYFEGLIAYQGQRNEKLLSETAILDKIIVDIKDIEGKKSKLLAKIDLIQKLQESRPEIVHLFDEIPKTTPDGVFLSKLSQTESELIFEGKSQSNARISAFMRAIEASHWLQAPILNVIQSADKQAANKTDSEQLSDFTLHAKLGKQITETKNGGSNEPVGN